MFFLKLFSPLKWALIQVLINLSKVQNSQMDNIQNQISITKLQLMAVCGFDAKKVYLNELERLADEIEISKNLLLRYEQQIDKAKRKVEEIKANDQNQ